MLSHCGWRHCSNMRLPHPPQSKTFTSPSSFCAVYSRRQRLLCLVSGGSRAARMASSNTFFSPRWERYGKKHEQKGCFSDMVLYLCVKGLNVQVTTDWQIGLQLFGLSCSLMSDSADPPLAHRSKDYLPNVTFYNVVRQTIYGNLSSHNISSSSGRHLSSTINISTK